MQGPCLAFKRADIHRLSHVLCRSGGFNYKNRLATLIDNDEPTLMV